MNSLPLSHVIISQLMRFYWLVTGYWFGWVLVTDLLSLVTLNSYVGLSAFSKKVSKVRLEGFSTTWPNLFSNTFATVGEF